MPCDELGTFGFTSSTRCFSPRVEQGRTPDWLLFRSVQVPSHGKVITDTRVRQMGYREVRRTAKTAEYMFCREKIIVGVWWNWSEVWLDVLTLSLPRVINFKFHRTVWRTWLFVAYSDEIWLYTVLPILTSSRIHFSWKCWENVLFELGSERLRLLESLTARELARQMRAEHDSSP